MKLNTSSKICISKRLTITMLLLIMVGFSVVVFSTLSSSVNKTTSSKAAGPDSIALRDFGGKNMPCALDPTHKQYFCNNETSLVCDGSLDFWLSNDTTRFNYWKENKGQGPKCIDPVDVPMGKMGQLCRKEGQGVRQCDSGLACIEVFDNKQFAVPSKSFFQYFISIYKGNKLPGFRFNIDSKQLTFVDDVVGQWLELANAIANYTHWRDEIKNPIFPQPRGVCIPESFSKIESCGDVGQKACYDGQKHYCFDNNRRIYSVEVGEYRCEPKISIGSKGFVKCDDTSGTCSEYCSKQNAKCVDTCDRKVLKRAGDEYYEKIEKVGAYHDYKDGNDSLGACEDRYLSNQTSSSRNNISLTAACSVEYQTYCCCDKK